MIKAFVGFLIALVVGAFFLWEPVLVSLITPSAPLPAQAPLIIEVPKGATLSGVSAELERKGLIKNSRLFRLYARVKGQSSAMKLGEYEIRAGSNPKQILAVLTSGKSKQYTVTFPEGSNIFEMAAAMDQTKLYPGSEFLKLVRDREFVRSMIGEDHGSLEGYLFPETYSFTKFTKLRELVTAMVDRFKISFTEAAKGYSGPLTRHQVVTLASVIEKETGAPQERPLISSVFHNRLQKGMRLQSDPTIIYGFWSETGSALKNIRKADILKSTPYNTYTVKALPVGPVANPGFEALRAAMFPAESPHLYFVSRNDGTHIFTSTYEDHLRAVKDYQLNAKAREGKSWRQLGK